MFIKNMSLSYPFMILKSIGKKTFENIGRIIHRSGDTVSRSLFPEEKSFEIMRNICTSMFTESKRLFVIIDDTLIRKIFSSNIAGTGYFFDQQLGRRITAFKLVVGMISDGKYSIPIFSDYLFDHELIKHIIWKPESKVEIAKRFVEFALKLFPGKEMIVVADGLYSTKAFLTWCKHSGVKTEMRMHSNRVVVYEGKKMSLKMLLNQRGIRPKGRQMARTITATWHDVEYEITIVRRIDRHNKESIVFQVSTYKALPREHVHAYQCRWPVEKLNRTTKQRLGLQDCLATSFQKQRDHVAAVFLAYA